MSHFSFQIILFVRVRLSRACTYHFKGDLSVNKYQDSKYRSYAYTMYIKTKESSVFHFMRQTMLLFKQTLFMDSRSVTFKCIYCLDHHKCCKILKVSGSFYTDVYS